MQMRNISRELVTFQRRLEQLGNDRPEGGIHLEREDVAALIEALQSTNAELHSINRELEEKNKALARLNTDLQHLLDNIDVAVLFVDVELRITRFTPDVTNIFPLRASDQRCLTDFSSKLCDVDLSADLTHVLRSGLDIEREVRVLNVVINRRRCSCAFGPLARLTALSMGWFSASMTWMPYR